MRLIGCFCPSTSINQGSIGLVGAILFTQILGKKKYNKIFKNFIHFVLTKIIKRFITKRRNI